MHVYGDLEEIPDAGNGCSCCGVLSDRNGERIEKCLLDTIVDKVGIVRFRLREGFLYRSENVTTVDIVYQHDIGLSANFFHFDDCLDTVPHTL